MKESCKVETTTSLSTKYLDERFERFELVSGYHLQMVCEWITCLGQKKLKWFTKYNCDFYPVDQKLLSGIIGKSNDDCHIDFFKSPTLKGSY